MQSLEGIVPLKCMYCNITCKQGHHARHFLMTSSPFHWPLALTKKWVLTWLMWSSLWLCLFAPVKTWVGNEPFLPPTLHPFGREVEQHQCCYCLLKGYHSKLTRPSRPWRSFFEASFALGFQLFAFAKFFAFWKEKKEKSDYFIAAKAIHKVHRLYYTVYSYTHTLFCFVKIG